MEELLRLLGLADGIGDMSDEDLQQYQSDLRAAAEEVIAGGEIDDEAIAQLERAAEVVAAVGAEVDRREQEDADRAERVSTIAERLRGERAEGGDDAGDGDDGDGSGDRDGDADDAGDGDDGGSADDAGDGDGDADDATDRVAASAAGRRNRVSRLRPRRPDLMSGQRDRMRRNASDAPVTLVAAANLGSLQAGTPLEGDRLAEAMIEAYQLSAGYRGPRVKVAVARVGVNDPGELYGEERTLRRSSPEENTRKVAAVTSPQAITAAGGICAPTPVRYDLPAVGVDDRPTRDDLLTRFGADRGGIRTLPPPELVDFSGAVAAWTEANDQDPGDDGPETKPCLTMTCPDDDETLVDAITRCIRVGNFRARFFPEQVQTWLDQAAVWHARFAERRMLTAIGAGSTQVSSGQLLGASIDILTTLDRAVASLRSYRRLGRSTRVRLGLPAWTLDMMRADIARQMVGTLDEKMAAADAVIESWIASRNVNVTWLLDGETGQEFGPQGDGPLNGWPSTIVGYLFPEGSWLFLDGGTLDLGIIRDSATTGTNDYLVFAETFENVHFHGLDSWRLSMDVCPDGSVAGTVDISPCSTGS